ncbi:hypothetical protein CRENBAI_011482 [Crenichthys baileyi]|uniref:Uncharacterized protein n=1 Tax=Crenichthys baileyi TaxID=28760 RepID=A0AAV9RFT1_9TELE
MCKPSKKGALAQDISAQPNPQAASPIGSFIHVLRKLKPEAGLLKPEQTRGSCQGGRNVQKCQDAAAQMSPSTTPLVIAQDVVTFLVE